MVQRRMALAEVPAADLRAGQRPGRAPVLLAAGRVGRRQGRHRAMSTVSNPPRADPLPGRRTFFRWLTGGLGAVAAAAVGLPLLGYLFGARKAPVEWVSLGPLADFPLNQ